jgi:hypothetical protein
LKKVVIFEKLNYILLLLLRSTRMCVGVHTRSKSKGDIEPGSEGEGVNYSM